MRLLEQKTIILTGAAGGLGQAYAEALMQQGANLVLSDMGCDVEGRGQDPLPVQKLAKELVARGGRAVAYASDITQPGAAEELMDLAMQHYGQIDALICNAGIVRERPFLSTTDADLMDPWQVLVLAPYRLSQAFVRVARQSEKPKSIVLTTSPGAFFGVARQSALATAHAGVVGLTRSMSLELRKYQIRVNAVAPLAKTRMTQDLPLFAGMSTSSLEPNTVAPLTVFLVSDQSEKVSGEIIGIAGSRVYALRISETAGVYCDYSPVDANFLSENWNAIFR